MASKKNFLIFLTSTLFILLAYNAFAGEGCCEKTASSQYCIYTNESNCDTNAKFTYTTCEQTSFCQPGCCYSSTEGRCFKNIPRKQCEEEHPSNIWKDKSNCEIDQCVKGCCVIGTQASYVTEVRCKKETEKFKDIKMQFDKEIKTEAECIASVQSLEQGCCVKEDKTCEFTTRKSCPTASTDVRFVNASSDIGFHEKMLCSNDKLNCKCAKQHHTDCVADSDKIYWFDSCGNKENVYDKDKVKSYNNGFMLKNATCRLSGANDPNCGDCNYDEGTICVEDKNHLAKTGNKICGGTECKKTWDDVVSPNSGGDKKNGESWCIYDSVVGHGKDLVGSRHYRHLCINGEEMVEGCKDYREEICVQGILGRPPTGTYEALYKTADKNEYVEAACRQNRWSTCWACNKLDTCTYSACGGLTNDPNDKDHPHEKLKDCCGQHCCNDMEVRDCYWLTAGITAAIKGSGSCVPEVPPGVKFWGDTQTTGVTTTNGADTCNKGDSECKVIFYRGGWKKIFDREDFKILQNKECTKPAWVIAGNTYCKSMGDCGAYYNILGVVTMDGYGNTASKERDFFDGYTLTATDVADWTTLSSAPSTRDKTPKFMEELFGSEGKGRAGGWVILGGMVASGLYGGFANPTGGKFTQAFTSGITGGPQAILNLFKPGAGISAFSHGTKLGTTTLTKGSIVRAGTLTDDSSKTLLKLGEQGVVKPVPGQANVYEIVDPAKVTEAGGNNLFGANAQTLSGGGFMSALNTALWIYTVYKLVDTLAAQTEKKTYIIDCKAWQAPKGGENCEKCNNKMKPCSEYKCKSLGAMCAIVNPGSANESCIALHPNDVNSPIITPNKKIMNFSITEQTLEGNKGFTIDEKIEAFTAITLSVNTNEPAQCKVSEKPKQKYKDMVSYFGSSEYLYNHTITFSPPGELAEDNAIKLTNGGNYKLYIRCTDGKGNDNDRDYFIQFKIKPGPDLTPPQIKFTSIQNNAFVAASTTGTPLSIFVNEPSECKWSRKDVHYDMMNITMDCQNSVGSQSTIYAGTYECATALTNVSLGENKFYIRCKDKPRARDDKERNVNEESFVFTLKGTVGLNITSIGPAGLIYTSDIILKAKTKNGAEDGKAICGYSKDSPSGFESMIAFVNTSDSSHEQPLKSVPTGTYTYYITCQDMAGNKDERNTTFTISVDASPPVLQEVYVDYSGPILHLRFDEESTCEYKATPGFKLGEGAQMLSPNSTIQETTANLENYYVICKDNFNNQGSYTIEL